MNQQAVTTLLGNPKGPIEVGNTMSQTLLGNSKGPVELGNPNNCVWPQEVDR